MTLLDPNKWPHKAHVQEDVYANGTYGGRKIVGYQTVLAGQPAWLQPNGATDAEELARMRITATHRCYLLSDPRVKGKRRRLLIDNKAYDITGAVDATAGLGKAWKVFVDEEFDDVEKDNEYPGG